MLGFTFKENCPDVRNTKVVDIVKALQEYNLNITIYDPWANPAIAEHEYGLKVTNELPHDKFDALTSIQGFRLRRFAPSAAAEEHRPPLTR